MPHIISKSINGTISDNHGQPIEGLVVIAYRKTSKASFETLGQPTLTNGEGKYIIYHKGIEGPIVGQKLKGINIFIRVFIEDNLMAESAVLRNVNN